MKKIISLVTCMFLLTASTAMAAALATGNVTTDDGLQIYGGTSDADAASATTSTLIGKTSKGVKAGFAYSGTGYAANTKHDSGNTAYGTSNEATAIYKSEIGLTTALTAPSVSTVAAFTTWTAM